MPIDGIAGCCPKGLKQHYCTSSVVVVVVVVVAAAVVVVPFNSIAKTFSITDDSLGSLNNSPSQYGNIVNGL